MLLLHFKAVRLSLQSLLAVALISPATGVFAAPQARPAPKVRANSTLGAGDVISVKVLRHEELSDESITVPADGFINLPEAGSIYVKGKTPAQVATAVRRGLQQLLVAPQVTVSLKSKLVPVRQVVVSGSVSKTGVYDIRPGWRVSDALAAAGGVLGRLDETTATLNRPGQTPKSLSLATIRSNTSSPLNYLLREGDTISVVALEPQRITVSGDAVNKPDEYPLRRAPRLSNAINAAQGLRSSARQSRAFLVRRGQRIELNLIDALEFNSPEANIELKNGDFLQIDSVPQLKVTVDGRFVRTPGNYELVPGASAVQAIAQANGITAAPEKVVAVVRRGMQVIPLDLTRAAVDPSKDVPLVSGDYIAVNAPEGIDVQITGAVKTSGTLRLKPNTTVYDAIAEAGGLSIQPEDARITILRDPALAEITGTPLEGGRQIALSVDPVALYVNRDLSQNTPLKNGDLVTVTQIQKSTATVSGEVFKPGPFEIKEGESLPSLLAKAGGSTDKAALTRVVLQRGGKSQIIDLYDAVKGNSTSSITLQNGDFVTVPRNEGRVSVVQAVPKPGDITLPERRPLTGVDALNLAGGPRDRNTREIGLLRVNPKTQGGVEQRILQLKKLYANDPTQNVVLKDGDMLVVPDGKSGTNLLSLVGQIIGTATGLRYLGGG